MLFENIFSLYSIAFAKTVVYMLQATEYSIPAYLKWFWRTSNFRKVMYRRSLVMTRPAKVFLALMYLGMLVQFSVAILLIVIWSKNGSIHNLPAAFGLFLLTPILWAHLIVVPLLLGRILVRWPQSVVYRSQSSKFFAAHPAVKIAIAGSYGKTTMKEILQTVLSEGKKVAATPGNKNVAVSHARWIQSLEGNEEVLLIEYGEGAPGDVARFAKTTHPNIGIITGIAPAHLDKYKSLQAAGNDIFALAEYLDNKDIFVNGESELAKPFVKKSHFTYDSKHVLGWKITDVLTDINGLKFTMKKGDQSLKLKSGLIGEHQIGPLALAVALADKFGLSKSQIEKAVAKTQPFEHRMQPYTLNGAWVIDDTYNGNIEGMLAGLKILHEFSGRRKIFVTPGLVDQGPETSKVHHQLGVAIAKAKPDIVVLMKNSVTGYVVKGLEEGNYKGNLTVEEDPLDFYTNLGHFVAAGDLVLLQNDWPDNYF